MAVNLSARQFRHPTLASMVEDSLRENDIDPRGSRSSSPRALLMEDTEASRDMLANFARMGVRLAIDDFGTGHSSLSYLQALQCRHPEDRPLLRDARRTTPRLPPSPRPWSRWATACR